MLFSAMRASTALISGLGGGEGGTGGGGGRFSTVTSIDARAFSPRESLQVALTAITPGDTPVVFSITETPVPETLPPIDVQEMVTGTPSGLAQLADKFTVPPVGTLFGLAEIDDRVGGFFGGSGFTIKSAVQLASLFFFALASVTWAVTV
jgi:hypothetical protein